MSDRSDRYVEKVLARVVASSARKEALAADLASHFESAAERGEADADVIRRLGSVEDVAASFMAEVELRYAGFWSRLFAFVGDLGLCFLTLVPFLAACVIFSSVIESSDVAEVIFATVALFVFVALFGVFVLYFPVLEHLYGKTPFKHVMKLRVVTEEGAQVGLGAAFIRRISYFFELLWLDALFVPFTDKKQRAFDIVAKTVVIDEPDLESHQRGITSWLLCLAPWLLLTFCGGALAFISMF